MRKTASLLAPAMLCLSTGMGFASDPDKYDYGAYLSGECVTCHQLSGAHNGIPSIVGWDETSFFQVMDTYRLKARDNKVMQTIAASLTDEDIEALAVFFAAQKAQDN